MSVVAKGPFKVLNSRHIYENPWIRVLEDKVVRPGGTEGIFGVVELMAGSSVFALTDDNYLYLAKEYKYGLQDYSVELISGGLNKDESPLEAAKRELREELGMEAREWISLGAINPFTNVIRSQSYLFIALGVEEKHLPSPDPGERIEVIKVSVEEAVKMVMTNEITNGSSCTLILKAYIYLQSIGRL